MLDATYANVLPISFSSSGCKFKDLIYDRDLANAISAPEIISVVVAPASAGMLMRDTLANPLDTSISAVFNVLMFSESFSDNCFAE